MSKVTEFYEAYSKDEAMQERANVLKGSGEEGGKIAAEAIVAFAKEEGYSFTEEELKDFINSKELSDDDLKAVAGGAGFYQPSGKACPTPY
jgi:predicted ribosomally synthesized peptide with nif11-like leader